MSYVFTAIDPETEIADVIGVCFFSTGMIDIYHIQIAFTRTHAHHRKNICFHRLPRFLTKKEIPRCKKNAFKHYLHTSTMGSHVSWKKNGAYFTNFLRTQQKPHKNPWDLLGGPKVGNHFHIQSANRGLALYAKCSRKWRAQKVWKPRSICESQSSVMCMAASDMTCCFCWRDQSQRLNVMCNVCIYIYICFMYTYSYLHLL